MDTCSSGGGSGGGISADASDLTNELDGDFSASRRKSNKRKEPETSLATNSVLTYLQSLPGNPNSEPTNSEASPAPKKSTKPPLPVLADGGHDDQDENVKTIARNKNKSTGLCLNKKSVIRYNPPNILPVRVTGKQHPQTHSGAGEGLIEACGTGNLDGQSASLALSRTISKDDFRKMRVVGQFNLGFIIVELRDDLYIIDQHASDEKYNFETLKANAVISSQPLIM
ncbi:DNA mismatch repair protein PMS1 [Smittium mucronatum]|uniref:DNA mismatch repair protein PMS1 n=1 Tax=Smittium mucronatum TaxID=133383 RepID=A0A1R0H1V7_9FUNG|nr:DNA mismatch repair protein PMS1 [Smittium mucronatum]